jgi:hypothetical protein
MGFGETVPADEQERFQRFAREITTIQSERASKQGIPAARVMHTKQHLGAVGELVVSAAGSAQVGVFAEAGKRWPVYVRFSNGSGLHQGDKDPDVRGFALKLVGVPGPKLIAGLEHEATQDFLFIDTPTIPFRTPDEFMIFVRAAKDGPLKLLPRLIAGFGLGRALGILKGSLTAEKVASFATHAFHTAAPIAFGATAAKLSLVPSSDAAAAPAPKGRDYLRRELTSRLQEGAVSWTLRAQPFVDQSATPIEDMGVLWSGPWVDLATLTLPKQDPESARGQEISTLVSQMSFDPWHATEEHRPLGAIMRARGATYGASVVGRKAAPEPKTVLSP